MIRRSPTQRRRPLPPLLCALIGLLTLLPSLASAADLRVMSFNIRTSGADRNTDDRWDYRRTLVLQTINTFGPDLLGLQEAQIDQRNELRDALPDYTVIGRSVYDNGDGEYVNVFYRTSRFTELARGNFWLHPDNTPGEKAWDAALPRMATWVKLQDKQTPGLSFVYLNTHFDHAGTTARQSSALMVRDQLADIAGPLPIIISGDFNASIDSVAYNRLMGYTNHDSFREFLDTFKEAHPNDTTNNGTAHGFSGRTGGERIDWILTDEGFETRNASIVRTNYDHKYPDQYPSDHFPITAVLRPLPVPEPSTLLAACGLALPLVTRRPRR